MKEHLSTLYPNAPPPPYYNSNFTPPPRPSTYLETVGENTLNININKGSRNALQFHAPPQTSP